MSNTQTTGQTSSQSQPGTGPLTITLFKSVTDRDKSEVVLMDGLDGMKALMGRTSAATKKGLPLWKMALYGDKRSPLKEDGSGNSLRWNKNVIGLTGLELDYDEGKMSFDEAGETMDRNRLKGMLYTTPSYDPEAPRWRLMLPFSKPITGDWKELDRERKRLVRAVAALFSCKFANESKTLSLSYYFGHARDGRATQVRITDGWCVDELGLADPEPEKPRKPNGSDPRPKRTFTGKTYRQRTPEEEERRLISAIDWLKNDGDWNDMTLVGMAAHRASGGSHAVYLAWLRWCTKSSKYGKTDPQTGLAGEAYCRHRWDWWNDHGADDVDESMIFRRAHDTNWPDPTLKKREEPHGEPPAWEGPSIEAYEAEARRGDNDNDYDLGENQGEDEDKHQPEADAVLDEIAKRFQAGPDKAFTLAKNTDRSLRRYLTKKRQGLTEKAADRVIEAWRDNDIIEEVKMGRDEHGNYPKGIKVVGRFTVWPLPE
jgi:hypothetical protein